MGSWALAEPISRAHIAHAHIAHPQCAPTMRAHIKKHEQTLLIFSTLRAPTTRAHMGDMGSTDPMRVHWFPFGAPYGGSAYLDAPIIMLLSRRWRSSSTFFRGTTPPAVRITQSTKAASRFSPAGSVAGPLNIGSRVSTAATHTHIHNVGSRTSSESPLCTTQTPTRISPLKLPSFAISSRSQPGLDLDPRHPDAPLAVRGADDPPVPFVTA